MRRIISIASLCVLLSFTFLLSAVRAEDWKNLLGTGDLSSKWSTKGNWKLDDKGILSLQPRDGEKGWKRFDMYLWSNDEYKDFEIEFDYKVEKNSNSGFYFHVGDVKDPVNKGIEVQIFDSASESKTAKLTDHTSGGVIPGFPPSKNKSKPTGEWDQMQISVRGTKLVVKLNGEVVNEIDLSKGKLKDRPASGKIGFQDHGDPLSFRNIRVKKVEQ